LPLIAFALQCHIQGAAVYNEMPGRLKSSAAASVAIAATSSCLLVLLYLPMGLAGYAAFGAVTQGDVLTNFGADDPLANVARGCIAITALCAYPMQHFPARLVVHNAWTALRRGCTSRAQAADDRMLNGTLPEGALSDGSVDRPTPPQPCHQISTTFVIAESVSWCLLVLGLSLAAAGSSLSGVFSLVGALCGGNVIFTIPGAIWLHFESGARARRLVIAAPLLAVGGLITVFGTYATVQEMVSSGGDR
jgi:amino acid permease